MWSCRICRLPRFTRGLFIAIAALAIFAGIAFIQQLEPAAKFIASGRSRMLQQITCKNCSQPEPPVMIAATPSAPEIASLPGEQQQQQQANNVRPVDEPIPPQADEILSPEEALPEEMVPDQEPPAVAQPEKQQDTAAVVAAVNQTEPLVEPVRDEPPNPPARISSSDIEAIKKPKSAAPQETNKKPAVIATKVVPVPAPPSPPAYENPPVVTRALYVKGHTLPAKDVCPNRGNGLKLMILVTTAPSHSAQREAVRSTWGHVAFRRDVGMAFFVGTSANPQDNQIVAQENLVYGDIIQGHFLDTYNNLTLKTISMLEWSAVHCNRARFLLKTDDDMYINFPVLLPILDNPKHQNKAIIGKVAKKWKPIRNTTSKYFISPAQFKPVLYPDFNTGPAYVLTNDVIEPLYKESLEGVFFKLEDVYVTGMMASKLKIGHYDYPQFFNRPLKQETCAVKKLASVHMVKPHEMFSLWTRLSDGLTKCPPPK